jgi:hypothetical protein
MPEYPPILQIPVSKSFRQLEETKITLRFDEPKEKEGQYGMQYMYAVDVDGVKHTLFASGALHRLIQEHNPVKGTTLSIARVGKGTETKWDVVYVAGPKGDGSSSAPQARQDARSAPADAPQARRSGPNPQGFVEDLARYWMAFDLAMDTLKAKDITPSVDANAVAFVIYKMATDHGISDPTNPMASTPTRTEEAETQGKSKMRTELESIFRETGLNVKDHIRALNAFVPEGENEIILWEDVTRDVGLAVYAAAQNVKAGLTTWDELLQETPDDEPPF